jgi:DNA mismatch repair protein MSH3
VLKNEVNVVIGIVAVQSTTGDIIYDAFQDNALRDELDTRLQHIQPVELILPKELTPQTEKLIRNYTRTKHKEESVRVERLSDDTFDPQSCCGLLRDLLESMSVTDNTVSSNVITEPLKNAPSSPGRDVPETLQGVAARPPNASSENELRGSREGEDKRDGKVADSLRIIVSTQPRALQVCLGALLTYLKDFGLDILFRLDCNFRPFVNRNHMKIDGNTLNNLELLRNQSNGQERGSLLWILDHTRTLFGRRLLINWLKQPLIDPTHIEARLSAVDELRTQRTECLNRMTRILSFLPDLERGITRICYKKCSVTEFVTVLKGYKLIAENMPTKEEISQIQSPLLRTLFMECPNLSEDIHYFLSAIDEEALNARSENKLPEKTPLLLNPNSFPKVKEAKEKVAEIERTLRDHLIEIRKILRDGTCNYVTKTGIEYLIEVKKAHEGRVPEDWILVGGTKVLNRYHTPLVREQTALLAQWRERLQIETENAWTSFLGTFTNKYMKFNTVMRKMAILDCLESLASVARQQGYVRPTITTEHQVAPSISLSSFDRFELQKLYYDD